MIVLKATDVATVPVLLPIGKDCLPKILISKRLALSIWATLHNMPDIVVSCKLLSLLQKSHHFISLQFQQIGSPCLHILMALQPMSWLVCGLAGSQPIRIVPQERGILDGRKAKGQRLQLSHGETYKHGIEEGVHVAHQVCIRCSLGVKRH